MTAAPAPEVMTVREAAEYMRISVRTLQRLTAERGASGLAVTVVSPRRVVLRKADVDRYLARRSS